MNTTLQRLSYEKLIGQIVYIEENLSSILEDLIRSGILPSKTEAQIYFEKYIKKVEAMFEGITIVDDKDCPNRIPFVVLDSSFTLRDINNRVYYSHLTYENVWGGIGNLYQIYFLSEAGIALLLKAEGDSISVNMGSGYLEHKISSIRI
jgi:transcription elongation GreA/GreB family factor